MSDRIKIFLKLPYYLISLLLISLVNFVPTMLTTNNNNLYLGSTPLGSSQFTRRPFLPRLSTIIDGAGSIPSPLLWIICQERKYKICTDFKTHTYGKE